MICRLVFFLCLHLSIFASDRLSWQSISEEMADSKILEIQSLFERAQEEKKVVVLAFLGGDLCPWSEKMRQEVLSSSEFIEGVKKMGYFFPLSVNLEKQKGALQKIFYVEETPTVVLFDYSQEEIARLSFLSMSPSEYVARFQELIQDFESVVAFIQKPEEKISEKGMIDLYERSKKLSSKCYKKEILQIGLKKEKGSFFALERYADLLSSSKPKSSEVAKLKKELLAKDSDGSQGIRLKVAI